VTEGSKGDFTAAISYPKASTPAGRRSTGRNQRKKVSETEKQKGGGWGGKKRGITWTICNFANADDQGPSPMMKKVGKKKNRLDGNGPEIRSKRLFGSMLQVAQWEGLGKVAGRREKPEGRFASQRILTRHQR